MCGKNGQKRDILGYARDNGVTDNMFNLKDLHL